MPQQYLNQVLPIFSWIKHYTRKNVADDFMAGSIVAIILIPQSMAYAMLAGLPPQLGLYSSVVPLMLYTFFGSSRALAVGPVGLVSLMTGATLIKLAPQNEQEVINISVTLALMTGIILLAIRAAKLSAITKFLSHPVMSGFTSAAAIMIMLSQVKHLIGIDLPSDPNALITIGSIFEHLSQANIAALFIGFSGITLLLYIRKPLGLFLKSKGIGTPASRNALSRCGPFFLAVIGIVFTWLLSLHEVFALSIVGAIPSGLPGLSLPQTQWSLIIQLLPSALLIAIIGFFESVSVAKSLASRKRERINADQEALALGVANIGASFSSGMPVAGGFARSIVNFSSGATSPMSGFISGLFVAFSLLFLLDIIYYLPRAILAAIICVAVTGLIDWRAMHEAWVYNKADAAALIITFVCVLVFGIEPGILAGVLYSIGQYLHRSSKPHIAVVGRVGNSEHYRNIERHQVMTHEKILLLRIDESLYFANTNYLEVNMINLIADNPKVSDVVIICSAVNFIDTSAIQSLETIAFLLKKANIKLHYAEIKGPIMDRLIKSNVIENICTGNIFLSTHDAMLELTDTIETRNKPKAAA
ncbi:MAG: sulfate permease [Pseudomonadota bacterium]